MIGLMLQGGGRMDPKCKQPADMLGEYLGQSKNPVNKTYNIMIHQIEGGVEGSSHKPHQIRAC